ncbi:ABC transporter permease [Streptomyces sp. NBC_01795]|uniref:ABC transporter permease n=1 Tax=unclassified Streptomyces TaxID=2593676 RepID=UPI002DD806A7|nr:MULTISPECIES: FtsX-like permease family protein [unclassified Streptomyces]WSA94763.1 ABC transporter permease [Streptomyces sp. NBC_01795]WSS12615.1 ABC transporter permease [Streptomyces sp. NBC_01186]
MSTGLLPNGLARAAVRFKPASFAGTFVALAMAAMIISACGFLAETGVRASVPPQRYAAAPVVVTADQNAHLITGSGEDRSDEGDTVPERARLDAAGAARKARTVPGVSRAVPDVTFTLGSRHGAAPLTGHGWGSSAFTATRLRHGTPPRTDRDLVLDTAAAKALGARTGAEVTLTTPEGARTFHVSGTTRGPSGGGHPQGPGAWFTDARAQALAGHPGKADALAVLTRHGADPATVADRLRTALKGTGLRVHTGQARSAAEDTGVDYAKEALTGLGFSFGGIAAMTAVFTASGTVALSVSQRRREFALLRAIGATPRQIRRTVATEAMFVAPLAGALGCLPGVGLASWWFGELRARGAVPDGLHLEITATPVWTALGTVLGTALLAGYLAARRPSKIKPGLALSEAARERFRPGIIRTLLGLGALTGGIAMARLAATEGGEEAANLALGVVMLLMTAVALLGQYVAKACAWLLGLVMRAGTAASELAAANSWAHAGRLASAITPVVLAMAFCSTLIFLQTSEDHATAVQQRAGIRADHIVTGPAGTGLPRTAAARAARTPGVQAATGLLRTEVLVEVRSDGTYLQAAAAQGVSGGGRALGDVQNLGIREGSLDGLRRGTVAVDRLVAKGARVAPGDRLPLWLPDGTKVRPKVAAVYTRGTGLSAVTLPRAALTGHVTSAYDSEILVRQERDADTGAVARALSGLGDVSDKASYTRAADRDRALNAWGNRTMALVLGGFAAVAAVNTLVMTVLERRREVTTLRLIGSTRRQVLEMMRWEAALVALSALALGTAIALATLIPMTQGLFEAPPHIPPLLYGAFAATIATLTLTATALPARALLHRP